MEAVQEWPLDDRVLEGARRLQDLERRAVAGLDDEGLSLLKALLVRVRRNLEDEPAVADDDERPGRTG